jgi:hypothetical protein
MTLAAQMKADSISLHAALEALIAKFELDAHSLSDQLSASQFINVSRRQFIQMGLDFYFAQDHISCTHLLIPQIEEAFRNALVSKKGSIWKFNKKSDGHDLKSLDEVLRDPLILELFGDSGALCFRVLFTDHRGWNLRSKVCHGLSDPDTFGPLVSDRLLLTLLDFSLFKEA